jgi:LacI family transcriptional regulator
MGAATIYDVAERAGVSIKSVSRVLNSRPNVSEALRRKVEEAADALGYRPSMSARGLAGASSYLIAALVDAELTVEHLRSGRGNDYLSRMELGALMECRRSRYHLLVELVDVGSANLERDIAAMVSSLRPDGLILTPPVSDSAIVLDTLDSRGAPYVRLGAGAELGRGRRVYMDDHQASYDMISHLVHLGHKDIGFVTGSPRYPASRARREGAELAMSRYGLQMRQEWLADGDFTFPSGLECGARILATKPRPTAIFASNDDMAFGVIQAATRLGLSTPGDLSVAGFDDAPAAQLSVPQLTTIRQPVAEMAEVAARMLIADAQGSGEQTERVQQVAYTLMGRDSTAPPRRT